MSRTKPRRSRYTGSLYTRADSNGQETYYGHWRYGGQQIKRRIGLKRPTGTREGLTLGQAETELRRLITETKPTPASTGAVLTIADLGSRYIADLESMSRKKATLTAVESTLRIWLEPFFGERDVSKIGKQDVEDLIRNMRGGTKPGARHNGDRRYGKPVGPKSVRNYIGCLSALLNFAIREELLAVNVASRIRLPRVALTEDYHFLTPDELNSLIAAARPGDYEVLDRALYLTAAMTGLREGELCALRWRDVDWKASKIRVRRNYVLGEITTPKSRRSQRAVPMHDDVAGELDRFFKASNRQGDDDLVFADPCNRGALDGPIMSKAAILRRYKRSLKAAKLDDGRFHDLRHTYGTEMAAAGVPMRTLQEWMGHASIKTTERYADFAPNRHEADLVAKAFTAARPMAVAAVRS